MTLGISFASLVKNNNGLFKSPKQAAFLLSQCDPDRIFTVMGTFGRNAFTLFYHCDDLGVTKVEKYLPVTSRSMVTWERKEEGKVSIQDQKEIKRLQREIKKLEKGIESRKASWERGEYDAPKDLFDRSQGHDLEMLAAYKARLAQFK